MSIEKLMSTINKQLGEDTIGYSVNTGPTIKLFSSGSLTMDLALGGGVANGRIIEYFGNSMAGKTTLMFLHIAEVQRRNEGYVAFIDMEHAMNKELAQQYGVDLDKLIYVNPKTAENAVDIADSLIRSGEVRLIAIDSVSAMVPTKIVESSAEQQTMGLLARFMSTTMQKLTGIAYEHNCTVGFINQIREAIGKFSPAGTPTTTSGGRALPFYASQRIRVTMGEYIKNGNEIIGHIVKIKVVKNKIAVPFKEASFPLIYGHGVDRIDEVAQVAILAEIIHKNGGWYRIIDEETGEIRQHNGVELKFNGQARLVAFLHENKDLAAELEAKIRGVEVELPDGERVDEDGYGDMEETPKPELQAAA
ncbi:recombinase RecA [Bacillus cereus]|uniref:recombinase RecA n=1 Tax=Bacillus tropicus TaxID=2026188 RepID=UPI00112105B6|nr:recombinase RecA [Bacillus tropicus]MDA1977110.1 recombinase RecA [Bacillus cereus]TNP19053.1 recombinase RecA [Bacillus tropicus]